MTIHLGDTKVQVWVALAVLYRANESIPASHSGGTLLPTMQYDGTFIFVFLIPANDATPVKRVGT
jgi:hypothetical protein